MNTLTLILTFPEGLIWPQLREGWYAVLTCAWFPIGSALFVRAWIDS